MAIKLIQAKAIDLLQIDKDDYDVVIGIYDDGQVYRVLKNIYVEFDDNYFPIQELMSYVIECNKVYSEINGFNLDRLTRGYV